MDVTATRQQAPTRAACQGCAGCQDHRPRVDAPGILAAVDAHRAATWVAAWLRPCTASAGFTGVQLAEVVAELEHLAGELQAMAHAPLGPPRFGAPWPDRAAPALGELRDVIDHLIAVWSEQLAAADSHAALVERLTRATRVLRRLLVSMADPALLADGAADEQRAGAAPGSAATHT